jgi:hypothetical protein
LQLLELLHLKLKKMNNPLIHPPYMNEIN